MMENDDPHRAVGEPFQRGRNVAYQEIGKGFVFQLIQFPHESFSTQTNHFYWTAIATRAMFNLKKYNLNDEEMREAVEIIFNLRKCLSSSDEMEDTVKKMCTDLEK